MNLEQRLKVKEKQLKMKNYQAAKVREQQSAKKVEEEVKHEEDEKELISKKNDGVKIVNTQHDLLLSQADLKKIALTTCLKRYIDAIDQNAEKQIIQRNACERLF